MLRKATGSLWPAKPNDPLVVKPATGRLKDLFLLSEKQGG